MIRRVAAGAVAVLLGVGAIALALGAGGSAGGDGGGTYKVRAIFDNASFIIAGEDVKVAGVKAGKVASLDVTPDHKAAVTLEISEPAFRPFHTDASCRIGLQSLIGEQFVDCKPTSKRGDSVAPRPLLPTIARGPGKGSHLLPVAQTSSPVGVDLLGDIMRVPERERFRLIINEFGTGLTANGSDLRAAIVRANPALQQADVLVKTLADQNQTLGRLVDDSDAVLGPLARRREQLGQFVDSAGRTGVAAAQRGDALEADIAKFPAFLRQLRPAAKRFGALADQLGPAVATLDAQAPAFNASVKQLGPFAKASTPAVTTLGDVAARGRKTFPRIDAVVGKLGGLSRSLRPLASNLAALSSSFDKASGVEQLMRFIYFYTGTTNGTDSVSHYIRSVYSATACTQRVTAISPDGCQSTFDSNQGGASSARATAARAAGIGDSTDALLSYLLSPDAKAAP